VVVVGVTPVKNVCELPPPTLTEPPVATVTVFVGAAVVLTAVTADAVDLLSVTSVRTV
jgi:hypothetical protein